MSRGYRENWQKYLDASALGYEVFAGNIHDSKTYQKIIRKMEAKYGKADRIWCSDRGMMSNH